MCGKNGQQVHQRLSVEAQGDLGNQWEQAVVSNVMARQEGMNVQCEARVGGIGGAQI